MIIKEEVTGFSSIIGNDIYTRDGTNVLKEIFQEKTFDFPKPVELIESLIEQSSNKDSIILDSFAGSGTTAHAVLNLNQQDGGNRKFILIEMEEYAETITAERVKRVIKGYGHKALPTGEGMGGVEGTGGSFDFYALGQPIFDEDGNLNEAVGSEKIRQYVWYTETQQDLRCMSDNLRLAKSEIEDPKSQIENQYFLGKHHDTSYYFYYDPTQTTTLDHAFLATMRTRAEQYIVYADNCLLTKEFMTKYNIIFKKIPRDITRF